MTFLEKGYLSMSTSGTPDPKHVTRSWLLIGFFILLTLVQVILIILFSNHASIPLDIFSGIVTVAGLFFAVLQAFSFRPSLGTIKLPQMVSSRMAVALCVLLLLSLSGNIILLVNSSRSLVGETPTSTPKQRSPRRLLPCIPL